MTDRVTQHDGAAQPHDAIVEWNSNTDVCHQHFLDLAGMNEHDTTTITAHLTPLPDHVGVDGLEGKWRDVWDSTKVYAFGNSRDRSAVYSIDTPPPTVSGHLHVGHVFSYTHTDVIARFKRMQGYDVFYPMGWDDNGLPTERRVQNYYGVRVDTSLPYDPDFTLRGDRSQKNQCERSGGDQSAELHCIVREVDRAGRTAVREPVAFPRAFGGLEADLPHDRRAPQARGAAGVSAQSRPR